MQAKKLPLLELISSGNCTFSIPVYQRYYDWKEPQCDKLFKDVTRIIDDNYIYSHFLGTIVNVLGYKTSTFSEFILIDGQQRITSVILLLLALYNEIPEKNFKDKIYYSYISNPHWEEASKIRLKLIEKDMQTYENLLNNKNPQDDSNNTNIYKNYSFFKKEIQSSEYDAKEILDALGKVEIVCIEISQDENPQLIFESLNSTGLSLLPSDLIRNYLLMQHEHEEQTILYKNCWALIEEYIPNSKITDFVRDFLTMKNGKVTSKDKVYESFKAYCQKNVTSLTRKEILEELLSYSEIYHWFINCNSPIESINKLLKKLQTIKVTIVYPPLLYLFKTCFTYEKISYKDLIKILQVINSYFFRRLVCNFKTSGSNNTFASLAKIIHEKEEDTPYYEMICRFLLSKNGNNIFPRDEEFKVSFISKKDFYASKLAKDTLFEIEKYTSKEIVQEDDVQVEHIMPQTLTPRWIVSLGKKYSDIHKRCMNNIGNLTLTKYNPELSNKSFSDKKEYYSKSNISITRKIRNFKVWNEYSIQNRGEKLFDTAKNIWIIPEEFDYELDNKIINFSKEYNIMEDINVTGYKPKELCISNTIYKVTSWRELFKKLCIFCYDLNSELFTSLTKNYDFKRGETRIISNTYSTMITPSEIANGVYIETTLSAISILNYCKIISEKFELQDDIIYRLEKRSE